VRGNTLIGVNDDAVAIVTLSRLGYALASKDAKCVAFVVASIVGGLDKGARSWYTLIISRLLRTLPSLAWLGGVFHSFELAFDGLDAPIELSGNLR
jgi:hypothetical protein